ncbi:hypothetical protein JL721_5316 [Aureococcus anophagefferens]|nr:hypothetical protein JL721_5316 [Aureococcus anophagefferens]
MEVGDCIVIDAGSASVKAGYSGEDTPRSVFPSILDEGGAEALSGLARSGGRRPESVECHFENAAQHPIQHGLVAEGNWEKMERLWDVTFGRELHQYPEGSSASGGAHGGLSVLLAEAPGTPAAARERAAQIMFETFKVPALCFFNSASLSLFASGRTRGVVLESGAGVSHAVPVFEGFALAHAVLRSELAGQDVTSALAANLRRTGSTLGFNVVRDMKEKLCRAQPLAQPGTPAAPGAPPAPPPPADGRLAPPSGVRAVLFGGRADQLALPQLVAQSIGMCDRDFQPDRGAAACAGTTMLPGFCDRMKAELSAILPEGHRVVPGPNPTGTAARLQQPAQRVRAARADRQRATEGGRAAFIAAVAGGTAARGCVRTRTVARGAQKGGA